MLTQRWRPACYCLVAALGVWAVAMLGYTIAGNARTTADKVRAYADSVDLARLTGDARAKALGRLAGMLNALSPEERRKARLERAAWSWLGQMTEAEKSAFIEATLPPGFKQMLASFEQLPEDKRRRTIEETFRHLRETQTKLRGGAGDPNPGTNGPPILSPELLAKIRSVGLQAFYDQSSAQTKAELAPALEELQRVMESGRPFRGR